MLAHLVPAMVDLASCWGGRVVPAQEFADWHGELDMAVNSLPEATIGVVQHEPLGRAAFVLPG